MVGPARDNGGIVGHGRLVAAQGARESQQRAGVLAPLGFTAGQGEGAPRIGPALEVEVDQVVVLVVRELLVGEGKLLDILRRTWKKMSERGRQFALQLPLDDRCAHLIGAALAGEE